MRGSPRTAEAGYSVIELVLAILVVGILALSFGDFLADSVRVAGRTRTAATARHLAHAEAARLRAAGGSVGLSAVDTFRVDSLGVRDPDGVFQVEIESDVSCDGGTSPLDNTLAAPVIPSTCAAAYPTLRHTITVRYASPLDGAPGGGAYRLEVRLGGLGSAAGFPALPSS